MNEDTSGQMDHKINGEVFKDLSCMDISALIERKNGLDFLSWSRAWAIILSKYPGSTFTYTDFKSPVDTTMNLGCLIYPGGTAEVECSVTILHPSGATLSRKTRLPVMDFKMKSIEQPTTRDISDCRARCLVKTLAYFGLGLSLWAGNVVSAMSQGPYVTDELVSELSKSCSLSDKDVRGLYEKHKKKPIDTASEEEFVSFSAWVIENNPKGKKK